jgi:hypothetical protein
MRMASLRMASPACSSSGPAGIPRAGRAAAAGTPAGTGRRVVQTPLGTAVYSIRVILHTLG